LPAKRVRRCAGAGTTHPFGIKALVTGRAGTDPAAAALALAVR